MSFPKNFEEYSLFAYNVVWPFAESHSKYFESIRSDLRKANINVTLVAYMSAAILTAFLVFILSYPILLLLSVMTGSLTYYMLFIITVLSISISGAVFALFYYYAKFISAERMRNIEINLPYAVNHMATIAASGAPPVAMFRSLARFGHYGEISKEAENIVRESESFGYDITDAILRESAKSPSKKFSELLIGLNSTITTGGDVRSYLADEGARLMREYRQMWKRVIDQLSIFSEIYVTLFVAAPVFLIVMLSLMAVVPFGNNVDPFIIINILIFLGIPAGNIMYLLFIEIVVPKMG
jgi:archaeal flagellar protein FlaJ